MKPHNGPVLAAIGTVILFAALQTIAVTSNAYDAARDWCRRKRKEVDQCPR